MQKPPETDNAIGFGGFLHDSGSMRAAGTPREKMADGEAPAAAAETATLHAKGPPPRRETGPVLSHGFVGTLPNRERSLT